ncbi:MAG: hypothetical protein GF330_07155 [Candidatus Eisenbacteria bacterium]|nr:hypothetical protein [Candidatus Eisenbacteria bacterium]
MYKECALIRTLCAGSLLFLLAAGGMLGCDDDATEPENQAPGAPEVIPIDFTVLPGDSVLIMASATDPDGDHLAYDWTFSDGSPLTAAGTQLLWTAPAENATVGFTVEVTDGRGGRHTTDGTITVHPNAAYPYQTPFEGTLEPDLGALQEEAVAQGAPAGTCHFWASVAVTWTNSAVIVFTGVPTLAFLGALTHTPVWFPPSTWLWAYTIPWGSGLATVELYATLDGATEIDWQMLISGTMQEYDRFEWLTGTSLTDATGGDWLLYDHRYPDTHTEALRIDWERYAQDDRELLYRNVLASSETYGDSLRYAIDGAEASVRLDDVSEGTHARVVWDVETGAGRFIGASGDSCCWGPAPEYDDIDCE